MSKPLVVIIPHNLGKAEATRRLRTGIGHVRSSFSSSLMVLDEAWTGDRLAFRVAVLKQEARGNIDVADQEVRLEVELPWLLAKLADKAKALIQKQGRLMLEKKWPSRPPSIAQGACMSEDSAPPGKEGMLAAACAALDEFMAAFNARDHERWVKCFHFPTVRLAGGEVLVWSTPEEFLRSNDIGVL